MIRELRLLGEFIEKRRAAVPYISAHICGGERGTLERSDKGEEWRTVTEKCRNPGYQSW